MGLVHGLDTIPVEIFETNRELAQLFKDYLPGWSGDGIYNFQPGAFTQKIGAQLEILTQAGSHPWINDTIKELFADAEGNVNLKWAAASAGERTKMMSALVNFMHEASGEEAIRTGGAKTGNFIAFNHRSDAFLLKKLGFEPTVEQMRAIFKDAMSWDKRLTEKEVG